MSSEIDLRVMPADGVTSRYAEASGDHNPIHIDEEFARSVGLPGRILHGLWTAAQVARGAESAASAGLILGDGAEARYALASLNVSFRGMGLIGPEVVVSGSAAEPRDGVVALNLEASQDGTRLVRNGTAEVRLA